MLVVSATLPSVVPSTVFAADFSYNGFGTAGYAQTDTDDATVGYLGQPHSIGSGGNLSVDSKLGLQVTAKFNDAFSATVQGVAYADLTGDWQPHLDWAYLRMQVLPTLRARVGYLRAPTYMYSDSVFVGYANTWVRPPLEVYGLAPVYQLRGIDLTWRDNVGPVSVTVNPYYGDSKVDLTAAKVTIKVPTWIGLAVSAQYHSFMARIGYSMTKTGTEYPGTSPLIQGLASVPAVLCSACGDLSKRVNLDGSTLKHLDVGMQYDDGVNLTIVEYANRRSDSYILPSAHAAYVTYGRRFGSWMPYASLAMIRRDEVTQTDAIPAIAPLAPLAVGLNSVLAAGIHDQDSYSAGVRYDLPSIPHLKGAVVKLQIDHIKAKEGGGNLNDVQPGFDGALNVLSASFDFIF